MVTTLKDEYSAKLSRMFLKFLIGYKVLLLNLGYAVHEPNNNIFVISSFEKLEKKIDDLKLSHEDLVVFDVDMVLTIPRDPIYHMSTIRAYKDDFKAFIKAYPHYYDLAALYFLIQSPQQISDERFVNLVTKVRKKCHQIYLTAILTGSFPDIFNVAEWRAYALASAGFAIYNDEKDTNIYKNFPEYMGSYPKRNGNLLITNGSKGGVPKGLLFVHYLAEKSLIPNRVIMVDDRKEELESVQKYLAESYPGIEFIGLNYVATYKPQPIPEGYKTPTRPRFQKALKKVKKLVDKAIKEIETKEFLQQHKQ